MAHDARQAGSDAVIPRTRMGTPIPESVSDRSDQVRAANAPNRGIKAPLRIRHAVDGVTGSKRTRLRETNSVALPHVDMVADTDLIREGYADRLDNNRWHVNGRVYVMEETGILFPERGDGIVVLTRSAFKALVTHVRYNGDDARVRQELDSDPFVDDADIQIARNLYRQRSNP